MGGADGSVWFRLNVGRDKNADPKWLIPLICRLGHVTKPDIGAIRIFERETKFEIIAATAPRFAEASSAAVENGIRAQPASGPPGAKERTAPRPGARPGPRPGGFKGAKPAGPGGGFGAKSGFGAKPGAKPAFGKAKAGGRGNDQPRGGYGKREA